MSEVSETSLPGVGIRYDFETDDGIRVAVIHHRTGLRDLVVYDTDDPDAARKVLSLDESASRVLAELLGTSKVAEELVRLQQSIEGLAIDWLPVSEGTPYAGKTIGDTGARTRTGVSIVAVLRGEEASPAPGPEFELRAGDTLVVVGTGRGVDALAVLLRTG